MKYKIEYDVKKDDVIEFFDPTLSYELTGYIPIDEKNGLDFDPTPFKLSGENKLKTGKYTPYPEETKGWMEFGEQEMNRIKNGYQVGIYRITGDHYFFLNYYQLLDTSARDENGKPIRKVTFPSFWVEHYKYFHYLEMCEYLGKDSCVLKSRGVKSCPLS